MMWLQYVADMGSADTEQVEAASIRNSLRRMSHGILVLENESWQGAAAVLPEEEREGPETTARSSEAHDDSTDHELRSEDKKEYSFANVLVAVGNTLVVGIIAIGYPVAVLPYYRAESTTEWVFLLKHPCTTIDIDPRTSAPLTTQLSFFISSV